MRTTLVKFESFNSNMEQFFIEQLENESYETKLHMHDCFQIVILKHGSLVHSISGKKEKMLRGDIFIVPPYTPHLLIPDEKKTIYYNISFLKTLYHEELSNTKMIRNLLFSLETTKNVVPKFSPMYEDIYLCESSRGKMRIEFQNCRPGREEIIVNCLTTVLSLIARMYIKCESDIVPEYEKKIQTMNKCIFYAESHYDEPIPLEKIVKMSAMSRATFCTMFKEMTGMTFNEYLNKKRIERVQSIIREGSDISAAAFSSGFKEFSTFYRNFVKFTGVSPSEFKKMCDPDNFT